MTTAISNILLVDDKAENLVALEEILRHPRRALFKATSGNQALALLLKHQFAVVLLDVEMPEMDGYETAQLMRSSERSRTTPIIFVTAGDRSEHRTFRGYEVGAVDFLHKPIEVHILRSKVDVFVELHDKSEELAQLNLALERTSANLRETVADLENANRTLSHDLRAPLRSIDSFARILAERLDGRLDPEAQEVLARIVRASGRMSRMLDDLFSLLRVTARGATRVPLDSGVVLDGVLEDLRVDLDKAGARVERGPMPSLRANAILFGQVLQNLIANALKFAGAAPPAIHISGEERGADWLFRVRDNGVGIEAAYHERIFGLFERLDGEAAVGSGVGLTLCKRAVEKHGGRIWVESTPGQGSTFHFTIARSED
jgi:two-component system, sensor histidine kinase and response regulator